MARVLIVEDSATQAAEIRFMLEDAGYETARAAHGKEALSLMQSVAPDVVVTDLEMPEMNGLALVVAIRRDYPAVPVILMTAFGNEETAVEALRRGAASYVPKAHLVEDLLPTLARILQLAEAGRNRQRTLPFLVQNECRFELPSDPGVIPPLVGYLEETLARVELCDATVRMRVGIALQEALLNAIYHGNLEVSSELRQQDEEIFHNLARTRQNLDPYRARRVQVTARFSTAEAVYTICDAGSGYDPSTLSDPNDPANLERIGGRGLLLIRTFMDAVSHNKGGREITMIKRREK